MKSPSFAPPRVERVIATARVALASASLCAVWLDPAEPAGLASLSGRLHFAYVAYAVVVAIVMWRRDSSGRLPAATHVADILVAAAFQYFALGPSSPFLIYFVFALFAAAVRWSWQATLRTAGIVLVAFVVMSIGIVRPTGLAAFEWNRFVIRVVYLLVVAVLLVYLGRHEARRREEIRRLARWPLVAADDAAAAVSQTLGHAAGIVGAHRALVFWSTQDEPWLYRVQWPSERPTITRHPPSTWEPLVADALADRSFLCTGALGAQPALMVSRGGTVERWSGLPVNGKLVAELDGAGVASAPLSTDRASGRVFFSDLMNSTEDTLPIVEVVGREIGVSLDRLLAYEQSRQLAIAEDRIRVARDLHDGVLQSLTGIRLKLQSLAAGRPDGESDGVADHLLALERALALEQRELRRFIEDLRPDAGPIAPGSLADRLEELRRRLALQWHTPVSVRLSPPDLVLSSVLDHDVAMMVNEAIANALKHGRPSRVSAEIRHDGDVLSIRVTDDGRGFAFRGRLDHEALSAANAGPVSLRDRVASLGGRMAVESSPAGSQVELTVPLGVVRA